MGERIEEKSEGGRHMEYRFTNLVRAETDAGKVPVKKLSLRFLNEGNEGDKYHR